MGSLKEKVREISEGWKNLLIMDKNVEETAMKRAEICAACPKFSKKLGVPTCAECGCPLAAKTRSTLSECPLKKW